MEARRRQLTGTPPGLALQPLDPAGDPDLAHRLVALQRRSYAIEAQLIGDDRIPQLTESVEQLQSAELRWLGAVAQQDAAVGGGTLAGAIAYTHEADVVDIHRLVVDPAWLRRGIGRTLVTAVLASAAGCEVTVSTGRDNPPARTLYESLGFSWLADAEVLPALWVAHYRRPATRPTD